MDKWCTGPSQQWQTDGAAGSPCDPANDSDLTSDCLGDDPVNNPGYPAHNGWPTGGAPRQKMACVKIPTDIAMASYSLCVPQWKDSAYKCNNDATLVFGGGHNYCIPDDLVGKKGSYCTPSQPCKTDDLRCTTSTSSYDNPGVCMDKIFPGCDSKVQSA